MAQAKKATGQSNPIVKYFRETRGELRKVTWPTREESQRLTAIVLAVTALFALFLGAMDFSFSRVIRFIVSLVSTGV